MAKIINKGYVTSSETSLETAATGLDYPVNFAVKSDVPGECKIVNNTTPLDRPEIIRFAYSEIEDVYKNTNIDPSVYGASRKGVQILVQLSEVWSLTDTVDASYRVDLPISAHIVLKVPACEYITNSDILGAVNRLMGGLYVDKTVDTNRLQALLRGSLKPGNM